VHTSLRTFAAALLAAAALWPAAASAQSVEANTHLEQIRSAFSSSGYQVDDSMTWDWTRPPVSTFRVHDAARNRVLMVLVYPSDSAAIAGRLQGQVHDEAQSGGQSIDSGSGPHLVAGFGPSTWHGNIALVQAAESSLAEAYRAQTDGMGLDGSSLAPSDVAVDLDFLHALESSVANL
jgi:hypothetical protein